MELEGFGTCTLCVPRSGSVDSVRGPVAAALLRQVGRGLEAAPSLARELGAWADLKLDVVLVGVDGCGTTTLRRHLGRHSQAPRPLRLATSYLLATS